MWARKRGFRAKPGDTYNCSYVLKVLLMVVKMCDVEIFCTDLVAVKLAGVYVKFGREFLRNL
jgi:hypothetical protein